MHTFETLVSEIDTEVRANAAHAPEIAGMLYNLLQLHSQDNYLDNVGSLIDGLEKCIKAKIGAPAGRPNTTGVNFGKLKRIAEEFRFLSKESAQSMATYLTTLLLEHGVCEGEEQR